MIKKLVTLLIVCTCCCTATVAKSMPANTCPDEIRERKNILVYDKPVNKFVAGFLGMPSMNFFNGTIEFQNNNVYFNIGQEKILLPAKMTDTLAQYKGSGMVLGIRPEDFSPEPLEGQSENSIDFTVNVVESLGDRLDVYLKTKSGEDIIASVDPHFKIESDDTVTMYVDVNKSHVFEPDDVGKNVTLSS